jgi:hypothetical protein
MTRRGSSTTTKPQRPAAKGIGLMYQLSFLSKKNDFLLHPKSPVSYNCPAWLLYYLLIYCELALAHLVQEHPVIT